MKKFRTGFGFDVHELAEGEEFWLGGILVPHTKGAFGHSDADVLIHAICDALLGSMALGDIGSHFPDTDPKYKGIDSKILLKEVVALLRSKDVEIGNIDATIALQKPKIKPHILDMRTCLAEVMDIPLEDISIKATTTEWMGFEGREEGVSAYCSVLVFA